MWIFLRLLRYPLKLWMIIIIFYGIHELPSVGFVSRVSCSLCSIMVSFKRFVLTGRKYRLLLYRCDIPPSLVWVAQMVLPRLHWYYGAAMTSVCRLFGSGFPSPQIPLHYPLFLAHCRCGNRYIYLLGVLWLMGHHNIPSVCRSITDLPKPVPQFGGIPKISLYVHAMLYDPGCLIRLTTV